MKRCSFWLSLPVAAIAGFCGGMLLAAVLPVARVAHARHYGPNDKVSCTGVIEAPNSDWAPLTELDSLGDKPEDFIGQPGMGGLCMARVYTVAPKGEGMLKVYRLWSSTTGKQWGRWWTFTPPQGSEATWRRTHFMCPSTGASDKLDKMMACTLKVGAEFVIGPGQSKECAVGGPIPQTATNSVYMALGPASYSMWVKDCQVVASPLTYP